MSKSRVFNGNKFDYLSVDHGIDAKFNEAVLQLIFFHFALFVLFNEFIQSGFGAFEDIKGRIWNASIFGHFRNVGEDRHAIIVFAELCFIDENGVIRSKKIESNDDI